MSDVIFYEAFLEEQKALKQYLPSNIKAAFTDKTVQDYGNDTEPPAKIISVRTQSSIPPQWAEHLDGILTRSAGYDHILRYFQKASKQVPTGYLINYCSRAVAEHAIFTMMALLRKHKQQCEQFQNFDRDNITGVECKGKKLLVVGVGAIGSEVVDLGLGLQMNVIGIDVEPKDTRIEYVSLESGIDQADAVICCLPLTKETESMLNYDILAKGSPKKVLVNISRGEISPVEDLKRLLEEGKLLGVGLDVYPNEEELADFLRKTSSVATPNIKTVLDLKELPNVILTPHNAFNTQEAVAQKAKHSVDSIVSFLETKKFLHPIPTA